MSTSTSDPLTLIVNPGTGQPATVWALAVTQRGTSGSAGGVRIDSDNDRAQALLVRRESATSSSEDMFRIEYAGKRGLYANEYGCARARATVSDQYAFRAQSHASAGANQEIGAFSLSDNTDMLVTKANGDTVINRDINVGRNIINNNAWTAMTLGTSIVAGTAIAPATRFELSDRVFMRGSLSWVAATIAANSVLATVAAAYRPASAKHWTIRTSATSNVSFVLELATDGTLVNLGAGLGSTTTAQFGLDGLSYDMS